VLSIRPAQLDERRALEDLQRRASLAREEYRELLLAHPDAIELPCAHFSAGCVLVAERDGAVVGFGVVLPREDGGADLDGLFVEPALWRKGIGAHLVAEAARQASADGATSLHVVANPTAEAFYLACGFEFAAEAHTRFGIARTMRKRLRI
jgi:GNAT superfamily N-acetyltransferase